MDQSTIEAIVRWTVRASGVAFAAALTLFAAADSGRGRLQRARRALVAFIAAHTIHFAAVVWLAAVTASANIEDRGGWVLMLMVAALFYASAAAILRVWSDVAEGRQPASGSWLGSVLGVLFISAVFLNSYFARVEEMPIYWLAAVLMSAAVGLYLVSVAARARSSPDRAKISGYSSSNVR